MYVVLYASLITNFRNAACLSTHTMLSSAILAALTCPCHRSTRSSYSICRGCRSFHLAAVHLSYICIVSSALHATYPPIVLTSKSSEKHVPCVLYPCPLTGPILCLTFQSWHFAWRHHHAVHMLSCLSRDRDRDLCTSWS